MEIDTTTPEEVDLHSIERLYREQGQVVWRTLFAYSGGRRDIADEATAEAFARALQHADSIRRPLPWIYVTAFRVAAREMRLERRQGLPENVGSVSPPSELGELLTALRRLSPKQRAAVVLHYELDLPVREVARRMGVAPATVKVHLHRARGTLRALLGGEEGTDD